MRKQQLRIAMGGAVVRVKAIGKEKFTSGIRATSKYRNSNIRIAGMKGATSGTGALARDCADGSPTAYRWHSVDWAGSIPSQFGMSAIAAETDAPSFRLPIDMPGQTYDATASCMNSMLTIATMAATMRDVREDFMEKSVFIVFFRLRRIDYAVKLMGKHKAGYAVSRTDAAIITRTLKIATVGRSSSFAIPTKLLTLLQTSTR